jgi:hypothetical protein
VELEVSDADSRLRVVGQLVPPTAPRVGAERPDGGVEAEAGRLSRVHVRRPAARPDPVRLHATRRGAGP